jgi:hypothetical protein
MIFSWKEYVLISDPGPKFNTSVIGMDTDIKRTVEDSEDFNADSNLINLF